MVRVSNRVSRLDYKTNWLQQYAVKSTRDLDKSKIPERNFPLMHALSSLSTFTLDSRTRAEQRFAVLDQIRIMLEGSQENQVSMEKNDTATTHLNTWRAHKSPATEQLFSSLEKLTGKDFSRPEKGKDFGKNPLVISIQMQDDSAATITLRSGEEDYLQLTLKGSSDLEYPAVKGAFKTGSREMYQEIVYHALNAIAQSDNKRTGTV